MKTKHITQKELVNLISEVKGATFATLTIQTVPNLRKTNNPYIGRITKVATHNVCLNFDYENSVNRQRVREDKADNFKTEATWGEHITRSIVEKDGQFYLQCKLQSTLESSYVVNGQRIDKGLIKPFEYPKAENGKQDLEKTVMVIKPKVSNVKEIILNKTRYVIL